MAEQWETTASHGQDRGRMQQQEPPTKNKTMLTPNPDEGLHQEPGEKGRKAPHNQKKLQPNHRKKEDHGEPTNAPRIIQKLAEQNIQCRTSTWWAHQTHLAPSMKGRKQ